MKTSRRLSWIFSIALVFVGTQAWSYGSSMPSGGHNAIAHTATVLETMNSAGYTYVRVEEKGKAYWIALPQTELSVGEEISFYEQMLMENFTSNSLNRTFDRILFVGAISKGTDMPTQAVAKTSPHKQAPQQQAAPQVPTELGAPVGQFTIAEVFAKKDELVGKVIEVKGKVSKLSTEIMGMDWAHIEDGSGTMKEKNHKLIFRSTRAGVAVGDAVVAKGVLYLNKDFGYGYFYPVIVENAVLSKFDGS